MVSSPNTLEDMHDCQFVPTDQNGWIELTTDGTQMWVQVER
jgi:hypothetical protein